MATRVEAAEARRHHIRQLADRPSQRRCAEAPGSGARMVVRSRMELRDSSEPGGPLLFTGYASVYEQPYDMWDEFGPYTEIVSTGAAGISLARADLDVPLVLGHDQLRRLARTTNGTLTLTEDEHGLRPEARLDPADPDVAYIAPKVRSGLVDEMSFAFRITRGMWSPDYDEFRITEVDIHRGDVAIVGYGANPYTSGSLSPDLRSMLRKASDDEIREALDGRLQISLPVQAPEPTRSARAAEPMLESLLIR